MDAGLDMAHATRELREFALTLTDREDGGLHISSRDVPGLHLSGADPAKVWAKIAPVATALLRANRGMKVVGVFLPELEMALASLRPCDVPMKVVEASFVVALEAA